MATKGNPPAFPSHYSHPAHEGMALRDYFAGKIASGMAAHSGTSGANYGPGDIAIRSYEIADAMLAERAKAGAQ